MPRSCCVPGCKVNYYSSAIKVPVFRFPKDEQRRQQWVKAIQREGFTPTTNTVVCAKHFEESCIITEDSITRPDGTVITAKRGTPTLTKDAYPTIIPNQPNYISKNTSPAPTNPQKRKDKQPRKARRGASGDEVNIKQEYQEINAPPSTSNSILVKDEIDIEEHGIEYGKYQDHDLGSVQEYENILVPDSINISSLIKDEICEEYAKEHGVEYNTTIDYNVSTLQQNEVLIGRNTTKKLKIAIESKTSSPRSKGKSSSSDKYSNSIDHRKVLQSMNISDNKDEFDLFGMYVASQLRQLPLELARGTEIKIKDLFAEARVNAQNTKKEYKQSFQ